MALRVTCKPDIMWQHTEELTYKHVTYVDHSPSVQ
jgi:hypothetical protein